jgi:hypothetical protein
VPRRPEEEGPEPEGGRAAERLRQHLDSRFEPDDWPEDVAVEDRRDRQSEEPEPATPEEVDTSDLSTEPDEEGDQPEHRADNDAEESPPSPDLEEGEEPPESIADEPNDDEGEDLT